MKYCFLFFIIISIITLIGNVLKFYQYHDLVYIAGALLSFVLIILNSIWYAEYRNLN